MGTLREFDETSDFACDRTDTVALYDCGGGGLEGGGEALVKDPKSLYAL